MVATHDVAVSRVGKSLRLAARSRPALPRTRAGLGWLVLAGFLAAWQVVGTRSDLFFLPPLSEIAVTLVNILTGPELADDVLPSLARALVGLGLAIILGVAVGLAVGHFRGADTWVRPVLEFFRAVPPPVVLPLGLALLGATNRMRVAVIVFGSIWPVLLNALDGARRVEPGLLDAARIAGLGTWQKLRRVVLPSSLVQIFAGLRTALALALIMTVISEMVAASSGLGYFILAAQRTFQIPEMWAGVVLLGLVGWLLNSLFLQVERRVLSWHLSRGQR